MLTVCVSPFRGAAAEAALAELERLAALVTEEGWSAESGAEISALLAPNGKPFVLGKTTWSSVSHAMVVALREVHGAYFVGMDKCKCLACRRRRATCDARYAWDRWKRANNHRDVRKHLQAPSRHCRVCKEPITQGHPSRTTHSGRTGEPDCKLILYVMTEPHSAGAQPYWMKRCGRRCEQCGGGGPFEVDHVVPLVDGGSPWPENLQLLCARCHGAKTAAENSVRMRARQSVADELRRTRDDVQQRLFA